LESSEMTLSDEQRQHAREKAIAFLEKNIFSLSLILGLDEDELDFIIPVAEGEPDYNAYVSLIKMVSSLQKLKDMS
jgi:hypothetical protein